jgi:membrane-bound serine protease (ClpP class)
MDRFAQHPPPPLRRRLALSLCVVGLLAVLPAFAAARAAAPVPAQPALRPLPPLPPTGAGAGPAPRVVVVRLDTFIQPVAAAVLRSAIARADRERAAAVVVELDTPGGLMTTMHQMTEDILAARTPVVVYVAPSGARAASAGFFLLMAADVAAMAPGTNTGAAHPVGAGGQTIGGTEGDKVEQDAAAAIRSLAARNGRDVGLAESAVASSRSWSAGEALAARLVDVLAPDVPDLLRQLDGRSVHKQGGVQVLHTASATVVPVEMTPGQRVLAAVAHPELAYMLLMLGGVGLFFEITHPGTLLPGVVGAVALALAFFGLSLLAASYAGAALILLGIGLFVVELKAGGHGAFALSGAAALVTGSVLLWSGPESGLRLPVGWIVLGTLLTLAAVGAALVAARRARRRPVRTGAEGLVAERGVARSDLRPTGKVFVHGEIWDAAAEQPVACGEVIEVVAVRGMTLAVRPLPAAVAGTEPGGARPAWRS